MRYLFKNLQVQLLLQRQYGIEEYMDSQELGVTLLKRLRSSRVRSTDVMDFMGVSETTYRTWIKVHKTEPHQRPPRGEGLTRLWHLLATAGEDSPELDWVAKERPLGYYLGQLMAFSVVDMDTAQVICGINHQQGVHETVRGQRVPSNPTESLDELRTEYDELLQPRIKALQQKLAYTVEVTADTQPVPPAASNTAAPPSDASTGTDDYNQRQMIELARLLGAASVLAAYAVSEQCTDEERAFMRGLLGPDTMFALVHNLSKLSGTRAFNER